MHLTITNRSEWSTAAINVIVRWVCRRERLGTTDHPYAVLIKDTRRNTYGGRGTREYQRMWLYRRYRPQEGWPYQMTDSRYRDSKTYVLRSRLELLVFILAHEANHATDGHRNGYVRIKPSGRRIDRQAMEYDCNRAGYLAVLALRDEWPELRKLIVSRIRHERSRTRQQQELKKARRHDPEPKLRRATASVALWKRKLKLAQTKLKKHLRRAAYYQARVDLKSMKNLIPVEVMSSITET